MAELVKINADLFPKLYEAFLHDDDPYSSESDWRNIFNYRWEKEEDHSGYALMKDGAVIGMMAMAFSRRIIDGKQRKFCNLHTWWVHEDHRGRSIAMLRPLMNLNDYTVTYFAPCDRMRALTRRLGFSDLDVQMKLLFPRPAAAFAGNDPNLCLEFDSAIDETRLSSEERKIFHDHQPYRVGALQLREGARSCFVLYTHVERYRVRYCHVHYIGNKEIYARHEGAIRSALMRRHDVWFVALDKRLVMDMTFDASVDFWAPAGGIYRPQEGVDPNHIDNLYSDVVMLRLATMPHVSHEISSLARQWFERLTGAPASDRQAA